MIKNIVFITFIFFIFSSCSKDDSVQPGQTVTLNDTSSTTGHLVAKLYDANGAILQNSDVMVYAKYEDIDRNLPLLKVQSQSDGEANFGYILIGNYYLVAYKEIGPSFISDTTAVQVLSQKKTVRTMVLR